MLKKIPRGIKNFFIFILVFMILTVSCFFYAKYEYRNIKTTTLNMITTKNVESMKLVFLGDFQYDLGRKTQYLQEDLLEKVVEMVNAENPDIILLGGDYLNFESHTLRVSEILGKLKANNGIYGILGNHDYVAKRTSDLVENLQKQGITILENKQVIVDNLSFCGVADLWMGNPTLANCQIDESQINFLLSHNPDYVETLSIADKQQFDLTLSGHLHAGQITFFGLTGFPNVAPTNYGEKYRYGLKRYDDSSIYITSGLGGSVMTEPLRFGARPEIVVIEIANGTIDEIKSL